MIKNQRQYQQTLKQVASFKEALANYETASVPEDVHPTMYAAQIEGLRSQLRSLENEAEEFRALSNGEVSRIELSSLDELPEGLIKARIARGLTQAELAEKLGLKKQQIQRWEFEDYESVGFHNLVKIAEALDLTIWESISLPKKAVPAQTKLKEYGIDKAFLETRIVPRESNNCKVPSIIRASERLKKIFGLNVLTSGELVDDGVLEGAMAAARFKLPSNADTSRVRAYAAYVSYIAGLVADALHDAATPSIPDNWIDLRKELFGNGPANLDRGVRSAWRLGIPVIPLSDPIRFHGCCFRIKGRNVIVLKQSARYESRWLFDLVHEIAHASEQPHSDAFAPDMNDPTSSIRRESEREMQANQMAGDVLLNGRAEELYLRILSKSSGSIARLKGLTEAEASAEKIDVGVLANYVAYRLKQEHFVDWWGAATNLQTSEDDPFEVVRNAFFDEAPLQMLSEDNRELINQALTEPVIKA